MVYIKLLLTMLLWGGTFVAGRSIAAHMGPYSAAFLRFALASLCLLALTIRQEGKLPRLTSETLLLAILLGMTGVFAYNALFFTGLKTVNAGRAAVIVATNPVFITLFAVLFLKEPFSKFMAAGITLSVSGAVLVISRGNPASLFQDGITSGDLAIMGCVVSWVAYSLIGKLAMNKLSPHAAVTWSSIIGAVALSIPALHEGLPAQLFHYPPQAWLEIVYLGLFGTTIGFTWYYQGVKTIGPAKASVFINIVPISAILSASMILHEPLDPSLLAGAILVATGVYLTNKKTNTPGRR